MSYPATTRRAVLAGTSLLAASMASTAIAMSAEVASCPDADVLDLERQIVAANARRDALDQEFDRVSMEIYETPDITEAMCFQPSDRPMVWDNLDKLEGVLDSGVMRHQYEGDNALAVLRVKAACWRAGAAEGRVIGHDGLARVEEIISAVETWRAEDKRAQDTCGMTALGRASDAEMATIRDLARRMTAMPARTPEGVCAKARVAAIWFQDKNDAAALLRSVVADAMMLGTASA